MNTETKLLQRLIAGDRSALAELKDAVVDNMAAEMKESMQMSVGMSGLQSAIDKVPEAQRDEVQACLKTFIDNESRDLAMAVGEALIAGGVDPTDFKVKKEAEPTNTFSGLVGEYLVCASRTGERVYLALKGGRWLIIEDYGSLRWFKSNSAVVDEVFYEWSKESRIEGVDDGADGKIVFRLIKDGRELRIGGVVSGDLDGSIRQKLEALTDSEVRHVVNVNGILWFHCSGKVFVVLPHTIHDYAGERPKRLLPSNVEQGMPRGSKFSAFTVGSSHWQFTIGNLIIDGVPLFVLDPTS